MRGIALQHGDFDACLGQMVGARQAGRTGAYAQDAGQFLIHGKWRVQGSGLLKMAGQHAPWPESRQVAGFSH
jgi:hypothetical protein